MAIMNWRVALIASVAIVVIGASLSGTIMSRVEQPSYTVVDSWGDVELRDYPQLIVAEVEVPGERKQAINAGFRMIADYIFGNNAPRQKIAMTAPVTQQGGEKIAMTASRVVPNSICPDGSIVTCTTTGRSTRRLVSASKTPLRAAFI